MEREVHPGVLSAAADRDFVLRDGEGLRPGIVLKRRQFSFCDEKCEDLPDFDSVARLGGIGRNAQNSLVERFDVLGRLFPFQDEQRLPAFDEIAVALQPLAEGPFVHRPAEPGNDDLY